MLKKKEKILATPMLAGYFNVCFVQVGKCCELPSSTVCSFQIMQQLLFNGQTLDCRNVQSGVPQGSLLGALLVGKESSQDPLRTGMLLNVNVVYVHRESKKKGDTLTTAVTLSIRD